MLFDEYLKNYLSVLCSDRVPDKTNPLAKYWAGKERVEFALTEFLTSLPEKFYSPGDNLIIWADDPYEAIHLTCGLLDMESDEFTNIRSYSPNEFKTYIMARYPYPEGEKLENLWNCRNKFDIKTQCYEHTLPESSFPGFPENYVRNWRILGHAMLFWHTTSTWAVLTERPKLIDDKLTYPSGFVLKKDSYAPIE